MWIKLVIVILLLAVLISLGVGLYQLLTESKSLPSEPNKTSKFTKSLYIRVGFGLLLIAFIVYAILSGQLRPQAPWDSQLQHSNSAP